MTAVVLLAMAVGADVKADQSVPVAMVDDASPGAPVGIFDYLRPGQSIDLGREGWIRIGYLETCRLETITGGRITIGTQQSRVEGGRITFEVTDCASAPVNLSPGEIEDGGVAIYRAPGDPDQRIYSATPLIALFGGRGGTVEIRRLDRDEPPMNLAAGSDVIDLHALGRVLNPGGLYEARLGERRRTFRVVVYARPGGPLTSRLVRL